MKKRNFSFEDFVRKLQKSGIEKEQAEELGFHLLEFNEFIEKFDNIINEIMKVEDDKVRKYLEELWGELETHIIKNHLLPAKKILNDITN